jgi:hypothetical protein
MANSAITVKEMEESLADQLDITLAAYGISKQEFSKAMMDAMNKKINEWREDPKESKPD